MRRERIATRRDMQLDALRAKRDASRVGALERQEPYFMRTATRSHKSALLSRQRERAWSQDIVFLPPPVAARDRSLVRERSAPDYLDGVQQVYDLK